MNGGSSTSLNRAKGQDVVGVNQETLVSDFGTVLISSGTGLDLEPSQIHYFLILFLFVLIIRMH